MNNNNCCCGKEPLSLKIKQGESIGFAFTLSQNNVPIDLSNSTLLLQVRENMQDKGLYLIEKTVTTQSNPNEDGLITDPTLGQFFFKINDTDIKDMSTTKPYYCAIYRVENDISDCISAPDFQTALFLVLNP